MLLASLCVCSPEKSGFILVCNCPDVFRGFKGELVPFLSEGDEYVAGVGSFELSCPPFSIS
jgi:hypothetical protein